MKKSGWSGLQISLHRIKQLIKHGSHFREIMMMDSGTTINLFGNTIMIKNRQRAEILMNFLTNEESKIVYEIGEIP